MRRRSFRPAGKRRNLIFESRRNRIRLLIPPRRALRKSVESQSREWTRDVCNRGAEHQKLCAFTFGKNYEIEISCYENKQTGFVRHCVARVLRLFHCDRTRVEADQRGISAVVSC